MILKRILFTSSFVLAFAGASAAQESGGFVVRLGRDTTGVERFTRSADGLDVMQVGRSPRVLQRHFTYEMADGVMKRLTLTVTNPLDPADAPPVQQIDASFSSDSMRMEVQRGKDKQVLRVAMPPGTVPLTGASPWEMYEGLSMRLMAQTADTLHVPAYYVGAESLSYVAVRRLGRDSVEIENQFDRYHAQVDRAGHIEHLVPIRGTAQYTVDRVATLNVADYSASFVAQQGQSGMMGVLSPRDTVRATAGGAALWVDYGRPAKRGRTIFGGVVPWGDVWRTGANAATQFKTDHALVMNGTTVPAGFYTLWSIPSPTSWKLVVNSETGEWGTEHKPEKDLYTIDMKVSALPKPVERFTISIEPSATGGVLHFDWDTRRGSMPFTTKP